MSDAPSSSPTLVGPPINTGMPSLIPTFEPAPPEEPTAEPVTIEPTPCPTRIIKGARDLKTGTPEPTACPEYDDQKAGVDSGTTSADEDDESDPIIIKGQGDADKPPKKAMGDSSSAKMAKVSSKSKTSKSKSSKMEKISRSKSSKSAPTVSKAGSGKGGMGMMMTRGLRQSDV